MTHRSVGVFIILAALLVAVPQASRDLLALAGEAGDQARSAVLRAFLGLNSGGATGPAPQGAQALVASCRTAPGARQGAARSSRTAGHARQAAKPAAEAEGDESLELAMILEHPAEAPPAQPPAGTEVFEFSHTPAPRPKNAVGVSELAMIIPPNAAIPPLAAVLNGERLKTEAAALGARATADPSVFVAARFAGDAARLRAEAVGIRRELYVARKEGAAVKIKACAQRSGSKKSAGPLDCGAPQFIKVEGLPAPPAPAPAYYVTTSE